MPSHARWQPVPESDRAGRELTPYRTFAWSGRWRNVLAKGRKPEPANDNRDGHRPTEASALERAPAWVIDALLLGAVLALFVAFAATCIGRRLRRHADGLWLSAKSQAVRARAAARARSPSQYR
jgi:hypothetical protein